MKRFKLISIANFIMFLLTLVPIQVHALNDVDLIKNIIRIYYESTVKEDLDTFLDTLSLETEEERERIGELTHNAWSIVGTKDLQLGPIEVAVSSDGNTAVASYVASGVLYNKKTGESFKKNMPYTAVLVKNGSWKLDRVISQILFKEKMKHAYEQYLAIRMLNQIKKQDMSTDSLKETFKTPAIVEATVSLPKSTGQIERIYTISSRPTGSNVISREVFDSEAKEVFVWFEYSDLLPGTILKGVWLDEGRQLKLKEFPILITQNNGAAGFYIRRPIEGWIRGKYRIDLIHGDKILGSAGFRIIE